MPYNTKLIPQAPTLHTDSTLSEILLWDKLENNQLFGKRFERRQPVGNHIVEFFCRELMLAIEIDGENHRFGWEEELRRQQELEAMGVEFVWVSDLQIKREIDLVLDDIRWKVMQLEG